MAHFTQKAILQTFQQMLEEMPFDKITVSAIVSRCEISSNTFYYHYRDIYDLLDAWLSEQENAVLSSGAPGDMGITKGVDVYVRKVAPLGDPVEVTVRGYELSIRRSEAENIEVA